MDQFGNPFNIFENLISPLKNQIDNPLEEIQDKKLTSCYEELEPINNITEEKIFVCFISQRKQRFYLAKEYQIPIIEEICESSKKDIIYQRNTEYGIVRVKGFKFSLKKVPIIGYINEANSEIYGIPMKIYKNKFISRTERKENGEYILYDNLNNIISYWPFNF